METLINQSIQILRNCNPVLDTEELISLEAFSYGCNYNEGLVIVLMPCHYLDGEYEIDVFVDGDIVQGKIAEKIKDISADFAYKFAKNEIQNESEPFTYQDQIHANSLIHA